MEAGDGPLMEGRDFEVSFRSPIEEAGELLASRLVGERDRRMLDDLAAAGVDVRRVVLVEGPDGAKALGVHKPDGTVERITPLYRIRLEEDGTRLIGTMEVRD